MMHSEDEILEQLYLARHYPFGEARLALVAQAVNWADEAEIGSLQVRARIELCLCYANEGHSMNCIPPFVWLLEHEKAHPEDFDHETIEMMCWAYKFALGELPAHPEVGREQIEEIAQEMRDYYLKNGASLQSFYSVYYDVCRFLGDNEGAERAYQGWKTEPVDANSNCPGCDPMLEVSHLVREEQYDAALKLGFKTMGSPEACAEQPAATQAIILDALGRTQRFATAWECHLSAWRQQRNRLENLGEGSYHLIYLARLGAVERGLKCFLEQAPLLARSTNPWGAMNWAAAAHLVLSKLPEEQAENELLGIRIAEQETVSWPGLEPDQTLGEARDLLGDYAIHMAMKFDRRNGNQAISQQVQRVIEAASYPNAPQVEGATALLEPETQARLSPEELELLKTAKLPLPQPEETQPDFPPAQMELQEPPVLPQQLSLDDLEDAPTVVSYDRECLTWLEMRRQPDMESTRSRYQNQFRRELLNKARNGEDDFDEAKLAAMTNAELMVVEKLGQPSLLPGLSEMALWTLRQRLPEPEEVTDLTDLEYLATHLEVLQDEDRPFVLPENPYKKQFAFEMLGAMVGAYEQLRDQDQSGQRFLTALAIYQAAWRLEHDPILGEMRAEIEELVKEHVDWQQRWDIRQAYLLVEQDPKAALEILTQARGRTTKDSLVAYTWIHYFMGYAYIQLGEYRPAIKNFREAYQLALKLNEPLMIVSKNNGLLSALVDQSRYLEAAEILEESLGYLTEDKHTRLYAVLIKRYQEILADLDESKLAAKVGQEAATLIWELGDHEVAQDTLASAAEQFQLAEEPLNAIAAYELYLERAAGMPAPTSAAELLEISNARRHLAMVLAHIATPGQAEEHRSRALTLLTEAREELLDWLPKCDPHEAQIFRFHLADITDDAAFVNLFTRNPDEAAPGFVAAGKVFGELGMPVVSAEAYLRAGKVFLEDLFNVEAAAQALASGQEQLGNYSNLIDPRWEGRFQRAKQQAETLAQLLEDFGSSQSW
ncbi:hypothetical protein BSR28_07145 [Boudabousia liubingyangii]|uniref:hypothetical protein n=1 Tax=Boudabousia liubingyangii TaxID=1921764 RepID=UPI0009597496|nr:hypothetical protein [Boudabousia liubingyangii]OKL46307.1 hypothetical protein BSR28_07145 [Boudabousia liubingyangii]